MLIITTGVHWPEVGLTLVWKVRVGCVVYFVPSCGCSGASSLIFFSRIPPVNIYTRHNNPEHFVAVPGRFFLCVVITQVHNQTSVSVGVSVLLLQQEKTRVFEEQLRK